jgi:translation elongation factor EF-G
MSVLRNDYCKGMEILESPPMVPFRETVTTRSSEVILVKSPNKHNRIYAEAVPLSQELCMPLFYFPFFYPRLCCISSFLYFISSPLSFRILCFIMCAANKKK